MTIKVKTKICIKCGIEKGLCEFGKDKKRKDGKMSWCKECLKKNYEENKEKRAESQKKYREKNIDKIKKAEKIYNDNNKEKRQKHYQENKEERLKDYQENKEEINRKRRENYKKNPEKIKKSNRKYCKKNSEKVKKARQLHYQKNKDSIVIKFVEYRRKKIKTDPIYKIKQNMKTLFSNSLKRQFIKKTQNTFEYTGISYQNYMNHFKKDPLWSDYCSGGGIHIDHIIPVSVYDFNNPKDIKKCWQFGNLRLLSAKENIIKSNKIDMNLITQCGITHLLPEKMEVKNDD